MSPARASRRRSEFLPFSPPHIGEDDIAEVVATLRSEWITTGPKTRLFEQQFGAYVGARDATSLMLNSCTAGLHIALAVHGVGPGDEVIVPSMTFTATANVVEHLGATPVIVDVEPSTLCMDPRAAEAAVSPRTKVIMPVHYAGHPADLDAIDRIALDNGIAVVEDAAHALPTDHRGVRIGSRPNFAAFSFYATKNLTTAEGGALTGTPELIERARGLSLHGMSRDAWKRFDKAGSWEYDVVAPGYKYNMTDIQASLGIHQLMRLDRAHERRRAIAHMYQDALGPTGQFQLPIELAHMHSSWHLYVIRLRSQARSGGRNAFINAMASKNIGTSVHYKPLHLLSYYAHKYKLDRATFPVASAAFDTMVSLPLHPGLSDDDVQDVVCAVLDTVEAT